MKDANRFQFIVTTPLHSADKLDRRLINGYVTRARKSQRRKSEIRSWISPEHGVKLLKPAHTGKATTIPRRAGTEFSGLQLPFGIEPYMIQELVKLLDIGKQIIYPYEICVDIPPVERGWFPYMISDACCLHSMMFSVRLFGDKASQPQLSRLACFHYAQTLEMLQARLFDCDQTCAISDATIMVVVMLATAAELMNEHASVEGHIRGLEKIVGLRGGVRALNTHRNMHVKVCRADLSFAISSGKPPFFFRESISWDCFIASKHFSQCSHLTDASDLQAFMQPRLRNTFEDVHALSCVSNMALQTGRKLSPDLYNEMMISILYRLTHLSFGSDDLQEAFRLGLLCICSTIFLQRQYMQQSNDQLLNSFTRALCRLRQTPRKNLPVSVIFWLLMLLGVVAERERQLLPRWQAVWLAEVITLVNFKSWPQAKETLRSIAWMDFVHDEPGERAFDVAKEAVVLP